ncbi:hypothetical protein Tco_1392846 [Tanacetum coccineum]
MSKKSTPNAKSPKKSQSPPKTPKSPKATPNANDGEATSGTAWNLDDDDDDAMIQLHNYKRTSWFCSTNELPAPMAPSAVAMATTQAIVAARFNMYFFCCCLGDR